MVFCSNFSCCSPSICDVKCVSVPLGTLCSWTIRLFCSVRFSRIPTNAARCDPVLSPPATNFFTSADRGGTEVLAPLFFTACTCEKLNVGRLADCSPASSSPDVSCNLQRGLLQLMYQTKVSCNVTTSLYFFRGVSPFSVRLIRFLPVPCFFRSYLAAPLKGLLHDGHQGPLPDGYQRIQDLSQTVGEGSQVASFWRGCQAGTSRDTCEERSQG